MVPLETVRGVYEKLSREAVEAQLMRPSPGRRILQEHSNTDVGENGCIQGTDNVDMGSRDVVTPADDDVRGGRKRVVERTVAWTQEKRAASAPATPVHRPRPGNESDGTGTVSDVTYDELPQRGLTQALVAQWREIEERARADVVAVMKTGTSRSRSLSGLAQRRGESPSPSRRAELGRSDEAAEDSEVEDHDVVGEQGRSGVVRQKTVEVVEQRRDGDDEEDQLPPPLMTQYMLAKFRDMEAETQITAGLQAKDRKVTN